MRFLIINILGLQKIIQVTIILTIVTVAEWEPVHGNNSVNNDNDDEKEEFTVTI